MASASTVTPTSVRQAETVRASPQLPVSSASPGRASRQVLTVFVQDGTGQTS
jgi:hypothetical protein